MNRPLSFTLSLLLALGSLSSGVVSSFASGVRFVPPPPPATGFPTGRREGGASRGKCPEVKPPLTALIPAGPLAPDDPVQQTQMWVWAQTITPRPTFWFYVPYPLDGTLPLTFVLQDADDNNLYQAELQPTSEPGVIQFTLPENAPALEVGKRYKWFFIIDCGSEQLIDTFGWVDRVNPDPDLTRQLAQASPRDRASLYAANGLWYEAITALADLRRRNPADPAIATDWSSLLQSVGVDPTVADAPLINCCRLEVEPR